MDGKFNVEGEDSDGSISPWDFNRELHTVFKAISDAPVVSKFLTDLKDGLVGAVKHDLLLLEIDCR
jgi:hypothetical protein